MIRLITQRNVDRIIEVDEDARKAIQEDQSFVESLVSSGKLRRTKKVVLTEGQQQELDLIFLK